MSVFYSSLRETKALRGALAALLVAAIGKGAMTTSTSLKLCIRTYHMQDRRAKSETGRTDLKHMQHLKCFPTVALMSSIKSATEPMSTSSGSFFACFSAPRPERPSTSTMTALRDLALERGALGWSAHKFVLGRPWADFKNLAAEKYIPRFSSLRGTRQYREDGG